MTPHTPAGLPAVEKPRPRRLNPWFLVRVVLLGAVGYLAGGYAAYVTSCFEHGVPPPHGVCGVVAGATFLMGFLGVVLPVGCGVLWLLGVLIVRSWTEGKSPFRD